MAHSATGILDDRLLETLERGGNGNDVEQIV